MLDNEISTRLLIAVLLLGGGVGLYLLTNRLLILRVRGQGSPAYVDLPNYRLGVPAVLYFTTPQCVPCKTIQRPALQRLKEHLGDRVEVIEVNAQERPDLASRWGVLSVPTTFILNASGQPVHINHGATRAEKLVQQVSEVTSD
jgi:thiol-disulfide isomerase/thioredoxin